MYRHLDVVFAGRTEGLDCHIINSEYFRPLRIDPAFRDSTDRLWHAVVGRGKKIDLALAHHAAAEENMRGEDLRIYRLRSDGTSRAALWTTVAEDCRFINEGDHPRVVALVHISVT